MKKKLEMDTKEHSVLKDTLQKEIFAIRKMCKLSQRIQKDLEQNDLRGVENRLSQRKIVINQIQPMIGRIPKWDKSVGTENDELNSLVAVIQKELIHLSKLDEQIIENLKQKQQDLTEGLNSLIRNKKAVLSYGRSKNNNQTTSENWQPRIV